MGGVKGLFYAIADVVVAESSSRMKEYVRFAYYAWCFWIDMK
jgi:hypothetical protein